MDSCPYKVRGLMNGSGVSTGTPVQLVCVTWIVPLEPMLRRFIANLVSTCKLQRQMGPFQIYHRQIGLRPSLLLLVLPSMQSA